MTENTEELDYEYKYKQLLIEFNKNDALQEELKQENFILKRELSREKETNKFVSDELEIQYAKSSKDLAEVRNENVERIERLSSEIVSLKEMNRSLEERILLMSETIAEDKVVDHVCKCVSEKSIQSVSLEESHFAEFGELKDKCTSLEMELHQAMGKLEVASQENADFREKIEHFESSLEFKRTELQEKQEQEEVLHEKIMELNMELNNLRMQPDDQCKKGNSLFAEVDDQRQKFRKLLNDQSEQYRQMKRAYQDGQLEIRRLRRENKEILEEMESCKELFKSSESMFKQGLLDKIEILEQVRENLQNKVSVLEEAITTDSNTNWVNTMLSYCRNETKTMKEKLFETLKQKSAIEENLLRSQQECARFKFEASELKTKLRSESKNESTTTSEQDSMIDLSNNDIDDSVQDFLKELTNAKVLPLNKEETTEDKNSIHQSNEPKYQNILQEKVENIAQIKKSEPSKPLKKIVVKKIVIPPRVIKK